MATLTTTSALSMKLFIDTKSQRVLFAEAGKDVVDFLFSLLDLPLATVVSLVGTALAGSAGSLHTSAEFEAQLHGSPYARPFSSFPAASLFLMPASSFEPSRIFFRCKTNNARRARIRMKPCCLYMTDVEGTRCPNCCNPMTSKLQHVSSVDSSARSAHTDPTFSSSPAAGADGSLVLKPAPSSSLEQSRIYFRCVHQFTACNARGGCSSYMADIKGTACPNCDNPMTETLYYVSPAWPGRSNFAHGVAGSVHDQEAATYTVGDNLYISQNDPTTAAISSVSRFGTRDLGVVEERIVPLTYREGLEILSALLHSKTVLTDVFVGKVRA